MVLHHGPEGWQAPMAFSELFEGPADVLEALGTHLPQFQFLLTDLSETPDEVLHVGALVEVVYRLFKHIWDGDLLEKLTSWRELLASVAAEETTGLRALQLVVEYLVQARDLPIEALAQAIQDVHPSMQQIIETTADRLRQEGHREGHLAGERAVVLRLLTKRFGPLPDEMVRQLEQADLPAIECWAERLLTARCLEDVFSDEK